MFGNRRVVVLFTESYPLGGVEEEAFVLPELQVLARKFDVVYLVPTAEKGPEADTWKVSENIRLDRTYVLSNIANVGVRSLLIRPRYWRYCIHGRIEVRRWIEYDHFSRWVKKFCDEQGVEEGRLLFYSFWLTPTAEYLGMYVQQGGMIKAVARAHRFDIYDMPDTAFRRKALQGLLAVYPCSQDGVREVLARYPELEGRVCVSYLGVGKPNEAALNPASQDDEILTFFSCHSLRPRKRGVLCGRLLIQLAAEMPEKTIRWILVGDGEEWQMIRALADAAPKNFVLDMRGAQPNALVHKIYETEHIDIAVLLSESEGLAVMDQEALSYGVPVIGTDVGGTRECVSQQTGALLPLTVTFKMFQEAVVRVLSNRSACSQSAFRIYQEMFDVNRTRSEFVDRVIKLMNGRMK